MRNYRVIVIGAGHAGAEAAWAAANLLAEPNSVALITLRLDTIGVMSCNPAIGGLAKGQLVREIDALGGLMGLAADATGIHFKMLNTSKGPAVHGPRAQCDKHAYARTVRAMLESRPEIDIIEARVEQILVEDGVVRGVRLHPASPTRNRGTGSTGFQPVDSGSTGFQPVDSGSTGFQPVEPGGTGFQPVARTNSDRLEAGPTQKESVQAGPTRNHDRLEAGPTQENIPQTDPAELRAPSVILTTGTFMRGLMHEGDRKTDGGRAGEAPAVGISKSLQSLGFELGRLKTGTPPRVRKSTIDWESLPIQRGDDHPRPFSDLSPDVTTRGHREHREEQELNHGVTQSCTEWKREELKQESDPPPCHSVQLRGEFCLSSVLSVPSVVSPSSGWTIGEITLDRFPLLPQLDCRQTHTTPAINDLIRANLDRAPIFSGDIDSVGPRYCPSIEDKVVRFADRESHGVFLEPESHESDWVYCNGVSTSLPRDIQEQMVRMMPGMARAEIVQPGYAVEYDMVRPHQIHATGETKRIEGFFLAGQINGTSGYEEAAAQGIIAGINAARRALGQGEFTLGRDQAYIGVLMDDLVTKTPIEPYRMFTSRAEHRILLRADNAPDRLTPIAIELGLLNTTELGRTRQTLFAHRSRELDQISRAIDATRISGDPLARAVLRPQFTVHDLQLALPEIIASERSWSTALANRKYAHYVERQRVEIRRQASMERRRIPELPAEALSDMRAEARDAMMRFTPATFGQASRLEGITPADLTLLAVIVERTRRNARAG